MAILEHKQLGRTRKLDYVGNRMYHALGNFVVVTELLEEAVNHFGRGQI